MTDEKPAMGNNIETISSTGILRIATKRLPFYLWVWLAGVVSILFISATHKARITISPLAYEESFLSARQYEPLLENMRKTGLWETDFPAIALRRQCCKIRCHVRTGNIESAETLAEQALDGLTGGEPGDPPKHDELALERIARLMEKPVIVFVNRSHKKDNIAAGYSNWTGYQILSEELKRINDTNTLARVMAAIVKRDPGSRIAKSISTFLSTASSRSKSVTSQKTSSGPGWAIVTANPGKSYDKQGKFVDYVHRGAVVEIAEIRDSKAGEVAFCAIHSKDTSPVTGLAIRTAELDLRKGSFGNIDGTVLDLFIERSVLLKETDQLQEKLAAEAEKNNPHAPEYRQSAKQLKEFKDKVDALKARFASSVGAERQALHDSMRPMKTDQIKLEEKYNAAKAKYDAWKQKNDGQFYNNPQLAPLRDRLTGIETQLRSMKQL